MNKNKEIFCTCTITSAIYYRIISSFIMAETYLFDIRLRMYIYIYAFVESNRAFIA